MYYGLDASRWAVEHRLHPNVALGTADDIDFPDNTFDLVFSCHVLEHIQPEANMLPY